MMKNIKKSVIAGALALAMVGTAIPVTANAATNSGTYTSVSISTNASDKATVRGTNNTNAAKYIDLYLKAGASLGNARIVATSSGVTNSGASRTTEGNRRSGEAHYFGISVIYNGANNSCGTLQSKSITY